MPKRKKSTVEEAVYPLDGELIPFTLAYKSVKNFNLRVKEYGRFSLSVPHGTSTARVMRFLAEHEPFLRRAMSRLAQSAQRPFDRPLSEQDVSDEATFWLLGHHIILHLCVEQTPSPFKRSKAALQIEMLADGAERWLVSVSPAKGAEKQEQESAIRAALISEEIARLRRALDRVIKVQGELVWGAANRLFISKEIPDRFPYAKFVLSPAQIRVRDMKSRWGSCHVQQGVITINARLCFATEEMISYVVCHELCHFFYPNHKKEFYQLLRTAMPNADDIRKQLHDK